MARLAARGLTRAVEEGDEVASALLPWTKPEVRRRTRVGHRFPAPRSRPAATSALEHDPCWRLCIIALSASSSDSKAPDIGRLKLAFPNATDSH